MTFSGQEEQKKNPNQQNKIAQKHDVAPEAFSSFQEAIMCADVEMPVVTA